MPKPKPDKVIRHELVLGRSEREMIDSYFGSVQFKNIATPIVDLMNDVTGTITFLSLIAAIGITGVSFTFLVSDTLSVEGVIDAFVSQRDQAIADQALESVFGWQPEWTPGHIFGDWLGDLLGIETAREDLQG